MPSDADTDPTTAGDTDAHTDPTTRDPDADADPTTAGDTDADTGVGNMHGELRWSDAAGVAARMDGDKCDRSTAPVGDLGRHTRYGE